MADYADYWMRDCFFHGYCKTIIRRSPLQPTTLGARIWLREQSAPKENLSTSRGSFDRTIVC